MRLCEGQGNEGTIMVKETKAIRVQETRQLLGWHVEWGWGREDAGHVRDESDIS
jgi:hypothetical protein